MTLLVWIVSGSLVSTAGTVAAAVLLLTRPARVRRLLIPSLVSYAVGVLLGAALLGLLPEALETAPPVPVFATVLAGMILLFAVERLPRTRHGQAGHRPRAAPTGSRGLKHGAAAPHLAYACNSPSARQGSKRPGLDRPEVGTT